MVTTTEKTECFSLRETKQAKLKLAIVNAFVKRLSQLSFEAINIKEICQELEISEGTFFNYFSEKIEVVNYYISLRTLKIIYEISNCSIPQVKAVDTINLIFDKMADELSSQSMANLTYELISIIISQHQKPKKIFISGIEKKLAFPELKGIEKIDSLMIDELLLSNIQKAIAAKEFKKRVVAEDLLIALITIMIGTLIAIKFRQSLKLKDYYRKHLKILWNELGVGQK